MLYGNCLLLADHSRSTQQGDDSHSYSYANNIIGTGRGVLDAIGADGKGGNRSSSAEVCRQSMGAGAQGLHVGGEQLNVGTAGPSRIVGLIKGNSIDCHRLEILEFLIDAESSSAAGSNYLIRTGEEQRAGGFGGDDDNRTAGRAATGLVATSAAAARASPPPKPIEISAIVQPSVKP